MVALVESLLVSSPVVPKLFQLSPFGVPLVVLSYLVE